MSVDIKVIKLKIRRGTDTQRRQVVLDQGELGFTTDTNRVFVGTGILSGGVAVGSKVHPPINSYYLLSAVNAEVNDIVSANRVVYQLTNTNYAVLSNWQQISTYIDPLYFEYNPSGYITPVLSSIDSTVLQQQTLSSTSVAFSGTQLVVNYNTAQFEISGSPGKFSVKAGGITQYQIASASHANGLSGLGGGDGTPLHVKVDNDTIGFGTDGTIRVINASANVVRLSSLSAGFTVAGTTVNTNVVGVDSTNFVLSAGMVTLLSNYASALAQELPMLTVSAKGLVTSAGSSIYDLLSCNSSDAVLSSFNGAPNQLSSGYIPTNGITTFTVISGAPGGATSATLLLSSAGFIMFEGGTSVRQDGTRVPNRFAIPVYSVPN